MLLAPDYLKPEAIQVRNGMPTRAAHAITVDAWSTYLAASRRFAIPVSIGAPLTSAHGERSLVIQVPAYCSSIGFWVLASGAGTIKARNAYDTYEVELPLNGGDHTPEAAQWHQTGGPLDSPAGDGENRSLQVSPDAAPASECIIFEVTSDAQVWAIAILPDPFTGGLGSV